MTLTLFRPFILTTNQSFSVRPAQLCFEAALSIIRLHVQQQNNFGSLCWNICNVNHLLAAAWIFVSDFSNPTYLDAFIQCLGLLQATESKLQVPVANAFTSMFPFLKRWNKLTPEIWHACMNVVPFDQQEGALAKALSACSPGPVALSEAFEAVAIESSFCDWLSGGNMTGVGFASFLHLDDLELPPEL